MTARGRPLIKLRIDELERLVRETADEADLKSVIDELGHRDITRPRVRQLITRAETLLKRHRRSTGKTPPAPSTVKPAAREPDVPPPPARPSRPEPLESPVVNNPARPRAERLSTENRAFLNKAVEQLREKLIDIGKRNPLIAFRHSETGATYVRIIDESLDGLFKGLTEGEMGFAPLPDPAVEPEDQKTPEFRLAWESARLTDAAYRQALETLSGEEADAAAAEDAEQALVTRVREQLGLPKLTVGKRPDPVAIARANGIDPSFDLPLRSTDGRHEDGEIRVLLLPDKLDGRLRTIADRYRGYAQETGIHTLQLVLGFVEWTEAGSEMAKHHAPLLTLPVHLRREMRRGKAVYRLTGEDEDLSLNMALQEMLRRNFGVQLPEPDDVQSPSKYLAQVGELIDQTQGLKLRRFATLSVLPFPNMAIWRDLDPGAWPEQSILDHTDTGVLLGAREGRSGQQGFPEDHPIEDMPAEATPPLILEADVSQHSALVDAAAGGSLAIEGPPGAGKSQTIANMIAGALSQGKSVLFVAEKQTALNAVADRLKQRDVGLGPLLFELHSDRTAKTEVMNSLRQALDARSQPTGSAAQAARDQQGQLRDRRDLLRRYRRLLDARVGRLDRRVGDLVWREMRLRAQVSPVLPRDVWDLGVSGADEIDGVRLTRTREALEAVEESSAAIAETESASSSPWRWAQDLPATPLGQADVLARGRTLIDALDRLLAWCQSFNAAVGAASKRLDTLEAAVRAFTGAAAPDLPSTLLSIALSDPAEVSAAATRLKAQQARRERLDAAFDDPDLADGSAVSAAVAAFQAVATEELTTAKAATAGQQERERAAAFRKWIAALAEPAHLVNRAADDLSFGQARALGEAIQTLAGLDEARYGLRSEALLFDGAAVQINEAVTQAERLKAGRDALTDVVWSAATGHSIEALSAAAAKLDGTSALLAAFDASFKAARALAAETLASPGKDAKAMAARLRAVVAWRREAEAWRAESSAKALFPAGSWRGHESDLAGLGVVCETLRSVDLKLRRTGLPGVAALIATPRAELMIWAERSLPDLPQGSDDGLAAAMGAAERAAEAWEAATRASKAAGLKPEVEVSTALARDLAAWRDEAAALERWVADLPWLADVAAEPARLEHALSWAKGLRGGGLSAAMADALAGRNDVPGAAREAAKLCGPWPALCGAFRSAWSAFADGCDLDSTAFLEAPALETADLTALRARLETAIEDVAGLRLHADLKRSLREAAEYEADWIHEGAMRSAGRCERLADAYELALIRTLLSRHLKTDGREIENLSGARLRDASERFRELDKHLARIEAKRILLERLGDPIPLGIGTGPKGQWTDLSLIENEVAKGKRVVPVRDLVTRAHRALQAIKPVWMMSPTTVAQYVPPGTADFDLVLIDEASQMTPEMAVGSLARGKQSVIVGDPKQLPPSNFFAVTADDGVEGDDDGAAIDAESILDLAFARFGKKRRLKWHYRSQHEDLIQFSNREFYDKELVIFPSPSTGDPYLGVSSTFCGGLYKSRINEVEARRVIEKAFELMSTRPELSMGIVTMNSDQRELLFQTFEDLKGQESVVRRYIERWENTIESFFIKNLENVQGDERDVIVISTLYGPEVEGGRVAQRFGLLNRKDGHRRLNVLVTRAKRANWIVTSLRPGDVIPGPTSSRGVHAFSRFLAYAEKGPITDPTSTYELAEPESDFELFVAERLRAHGYEVVHQVGVDRYRIDLGVRHADFPTGFLAGVECDGASYHSGFTVRDRDRIRQGVLEGLGWRIWRVWSTDWFNDPERETGRLLAWLEDLRSTAKARREAAEAEIANGPSDPQVEEAPESLPASPVVEGQGARLPEPEPMPPTTPDLPQAKGPTGRRHETPDGVTFYEDASLPGYFEVWDGTRLLGWVERESGTTPPARLFGGQVSAPLPQYVGGNDQGFRMVFKDLYSAVRKVALESKAPADS